MPEGIEQREQTSWNAALHKYKIGLTRALIKRFNKTNTNT